MHCDFAQYKQSLRSFQDLKQKGQAPILIIVGILAAVLIASGAYYLGRSTSPKPSPIPVVSQTPRSTPDTSPTPTGAGTSGTPNGVAETANWKTYTNTKVGFRISYPHRYPRLKPWYFKAHYKASLSWL